jgi:hypothetical protein
MVILGHESFFCIFDLPPNLSYAPNLTLIALIFIFKETIWERYYILKVFI